MYLACLALTIKPGLECTLRQDADRLPEHQCLLGIIGFKQAEASKLTGPDPPDC